MVNEVLCKILCHNICCLVQEQHELVFFGAKNRLKSLQFSACRMYNRGSGMNGLPNITSNPFERMVSRRKQKEKWELDPRLWKWMNQCKTCRRIGCKPELPRKFMASFRTRTKPSRILTAAVGTASLRSSFPELPLNQEGLCEQCAHAASL